MLPPRIAAPAAPRMVRLALGQHGPGKAALCRQYKGDLQVTEVGSHNARVSAGVVSGAQCLQLPVHRCPEVTLEWTPVLRDDP